MQFQISKFKDIPALARLISLSAILKISGILLGILSTLLYVKVLSLEDFGTFSFVMAAITILTIPTAMGVPEVLIRETARSVSVGDVDRFYRLLVWARNSLTVTTGLVVIGLVVWRSFINPGLSLGLLVLICSTLLVVALNSIRSSVLIGLNATIHGQVADGLIKPLFLILILLLAFWGQEKISPEAAVFVNLVSVSAGFIYGAVVLKKRLPSRSGFDPPKSATDTWLWSSSALPLGLISGMYLVSQQLDILVLGALSSKNEVAVYRIVSQMGMLAILGQQFVRLVVAPRFASFWHTSQIGELQAVARISSQVSLAVAIIVSATFVLAGEFLLGRVFGHEFESGYAPLLVLCLGQVVNASFGSTGNLLNMCGHERKSVFGLIVGVTANMVCAFLLVPKFGALGAAISTAVGLCVWNFLLWKAVREHIGVRPTAFGI